ncbi:pistil-specific extensin-like protein [Malus sylvestris]|uniref:pistil-specific extensin-like protein n=1 Tax=Malus sylvestris TaxID=3752 RepID=UPI0010A9C5C8|nr:pistil-specific extensin-like protein [Malus domestica]XP_050122902.1 pistil-specific extensin-like protein [Malus sylvestris]
MMRAMVVLLFAVVFIAMGCSSSHTVEAFNYEEPKTKTIHVGGKVLCQDCTQGWNEWVHGARPINGGKVSMTCMDERSRVVFYASDLTDEKGQFNLIMNKYTTNGKEVNANRCSLRLVSCPDATCNVPTNFGGGRSGVKLNRPSLVYRDLVKYTLGPFYYTSPMCEKPDTTRYDDRGNGRNY